MDGVEISGDSGSGSGKEKNNLLTFIKHKLFSTDFLTETSLAVSKNKKSQMIYLKK